MDMLWIAAGMLAGMVVGWFTRGKAARAEVNRLLERGGAPADPDLVEGALAWFRRRQGVLILGVAGGIAVGALGVVLSHLGRGIGMASTTELDIRMLNWMLAAAAAAGGIATLGLSYRTVRASRAHGPRLASLRQRRLTDYVSPFEIAIHYGAVVLPLTGIGLGLEVLGADDHPARGWILIGSGLAALPLWGLGGWLQRRALRVNQRSARPAELRWQETLRARILRDLGSSMVTVCWLLGGAMPESFHWPSDTPAYIEPLSSGLSLGSILLLCLTWQLAASRSGMRRVERVAG